MATAIFTKGGEAVQKIDAHVINAGLVRRYASRNNFGAVLLGESRGGAVEARVLRGDGTFSVVREVSEVQTRPRRSTRRGDRRTGRVKVLKVDDRPVLS